MRIECDYRNFSDPYKGLATMIFAQADADLQRLDGEDRMRVECRMLIDKWKIINFLRSPWAALLATGIGIEPTELKAYIKRKTYDLDKNGKRLRP